MSRFLTKTLAGLGALTALLTTELAFAQEVTKQQEKEELLEEFVENGDTEKLIELKDLVWGHSKDTVADARVIRRVLRAINVWDEKWEAERKPVRETINSFDEEMRHRTDQPFIRPHYTKPEEIPDPEYRQRYVEFLAALELNNQQADRGGTLLSAERNIRNTLQSIEEKLTAEERAQLEREEAEYERERQAERSAGGDDSGTDTEPETGPAAGEPAAAEPTVGETPAALPARGESGPAEAGSERRSALPLVIAAAGGALVVGVWLVLRNRR